jgi:hypothetical protein
MKANRLLYAVVLASTLFAFGAAAQTNQPAPTTAAPGAPALVPDQVIYQAQLPDPSALAKTVAAHGIAIERIIQTSNQVTLVYRTADQRVHMVVYQLLPGAIASNTPAAPEDTPAAPAEDSGLNPAPAAVSATITQPPGAVVLPAASPNVVYVDTEPAAYCYDPFYYPWGWPGYVSFGFGLGYYNHGYGYRHFSAPRGVYHYRGGHHYGAVRGASVRRNFVGHGVYQPTAGRSPWHH